VATACYTDALALARQADDREVEMWHSPTWRSSARQLASRASRCVSPMPRRRLRRRWNGRPVWPQFRNYIELLQAHLSLTHPTQIVP
jgi:hypothetical protein